MHKIDVSNLKNLFRLLQDLEINPEHKQNLIIQIAKYQLPLHTFLNFEYFILFIIKYKPMNNYWSSLWGSFFIPNQNYSYMQPLHHQPMFFGEEFCQFVPTQQIENSHPQPVSSAPYPQYHSHPEQEAPVRNEQHPSKHEVSPEIMRMNDDLDGEYFQRGQKSDRNIRSNAIKLFLKFLRNQIEFLQDVLPRVLGSETQPLSLDEVFPVQRTYLRPIIFISLCRDEEKNKSCSIFSKALRTLFMHFLKKDAHQLWTKKYLCNRKMLKAHLQAGRSILQEIEQPMLKRRHNNLQTYMIMNINMNFCFWFQQRQPVASRKKFLINQIYPDQMGTLGRDMYKTIAQQQKSKEVRKH